MGEWTTLKAADGHELAAWKSVGPEPLAGLVVAQEIFGVNEHIRRVTDRYASLGFAVVAPALFDRAEKGVELDYGDADVARGRELRGRFSWDLSLHDLRAAAESVRFAGRVGVIGYCWGGSMAWRAAAKNPVDAAVCYYGAQIVDYPAEKPKCPTLLIFGDEDASIPPETIAAIRSAHPAVETEIYPGPHGFACDMRAAYRPEAARAAFARSFAFLARHLRGTP
ncbi:MAG: dienelactone hydrolase family protein [Alphaproteobacteria bacterium]|nr:dienelactone hydrolase family protein [Alphaproteobacteria bacterium]